MICPFYKSAVIVNHPEIATKPNSKISNSVLNCDKEKCQLWLDDVNGGNCSIFFIAEIILKRL